MSEKGEKIVPAGLGERVEATPKEVADGEGVFPGVKPQVLENNGRREIFFPVRRD